MRGAQLYTSITSVILVWTGITFRGLAPIITRASRWFSCPGWDNVKVTAEIAMAFHTAASPAR